MAAERAYDYYAYEAAPERVPVRLPDKEKKPELKKAKKTQQEILIYKEKMANRKLVKVAAVVLSFLVLYAVVCNSFIAKDTARRNLENVKEEYVFAQAKNRELRGELNNLISAENIDRIAVEELGLVKVAAGSEIYLDSAQGNKVIFSQNK
ncbi:MAG: hypothetical protein IKY78_04485 [Clostridia bacterium]|nr:hypothetical protein [Clostridia bacterium]